MSHCNMCGDTLETGVCEECLSIAMPKRADAPKSERVIKDVRSQKWTKDYRRGVATIVDVVCRIKKQTDEVDSLRSQLAEEKLLAESLKYKRDEAYCNLRDQLTASYEREGKLASALKELFAMMKGESPSLLNEDSGGNARLCLEIQTLLSPPSDGERSGWQPIETAPRDTTHIMLYAPPQVFEGSPIPERVTCGCWVDAFDDDADYSGWASWDGGFTEENAPTHWMPLPQPPSLASEDRKEPHESNPT